MIKEVNRSFLRINSYSLIYVYFLNIIHTYKDSLLDVARNIKIILYIILPSLHLIYNFYYHTFATFKCI